MTESPQPDSNPSFSPQALRSVELWQDPFEAPDVPPVDMLRDWLAGKRFEPWLEAQIRGSVNCQRALAALDDEEEVQEDVSQELLDRLLSIPVQAPLPPAASRARIPGPPVVGELRATRGRVEQFRQGVDTWTQTFSPVPVLLLSGPHDRGLDRVWRAVAATEALEWPAEWRSEEDIPVQDSAGDQWIAHLWLEYPVSDSQLAGSLGAVDEPTCSRLYQLGAARPEGDAPDLSEEVLESEALLMRDRLLARCAFLPMTADARLAQWEFYLSSNAAVGFVGAVVPSPGTGGLPLSVIQGRGAQFGRQIGRAIEPHLALAAKTPGALSSHAILLDEPPGGWLGPSSERRLRLGRGVHVPAESPPTEAGLRKPVFAEWDVHHLLPAPHPLRFFVVLNRDGDVVATGLVRGGIAQALGASRELALASMPDWQDWRLVIFHPVSENSSEG